MPFGSLSNTLEIKNAEGFRGSCVLQQSYPLTGYSANVTPTPPSFRPSDVAGLALWYDATALTGYSNGASVGTWPDLSGNANNAIQATGTQQPTYVASGINSKPCLNFDGVDDSLLSTNTVANSGSLYAYCVYKLNTSTPAQYSSVIEYGNQLFVIQNRQPTYAMAGFNISYSAFTPSATYSTLPALASIFRNSSGTTGAEIKTSSLDSLYSGSTGAISSPQKLSIARYASSGSYCVNGQFGEILFYTQNVSSADDTKIRNYLNAKWAIY